jgi:hypothetical protein
MMMSCQQADWLKFSFTTKHTVMKQNNALKLPFFAKLLEAQETDPSRDDQQSFWPPVITAVLKDGGYQTMKYPSDGDEEGPVTS